MPSSASEYNSSTLINAIVQWHLMHYSYVLQRQELAGLYVMMRWPFDEDSVNEHAVSSFKQGFISGLLLVGRQCI